MEYPDKNKPVAAARVPLFQLLCDETRLYDLVQTCHWNVQGCHFFQLHGEFGREYEELSGVRDEIAEALRVSGIKIPSHEELAQGGVISVAVEEDEDPEEKSENMAATVLAAHRSLLGMADMATRGMASAMLDAADQDVVIKAMRFHKKAIYFLENFLKEKEKKEEAQG